jgi:hypothetical protein
MATALIHNVAQELQELENLDRPKTFALHGFTTGEGHDLRFHLAVCDHLPMIPEAEWCRDGDTLNVLREWLRDTFNCDPTQEDWVGSASGSSRRGVTAQR